MSDYLYTLESHLNAAKVFALHSIQSAAMETGISVYLVGGALRDMLAGFPIRDMSFVVEGNEKALAKAVAKAVGAEVLPDDARRYAVLVRFPHDVIVEIAMAREVKFPKTGGTPTIRAASIYEDLQSRDFTINAIAMSLNRASRGLLVDPTNGLGDLERRELRTVGKYSLYDDPVRILRMIRFSKRFSFAIDERTRNQYQNVREAGLEANITAEALGEELHRIADEPTNPEIVADLDAEGLLPLFCPALSGSKVNLTGLQRLQKARQTVPLELNFPVENIGLFLSVLCEKLTAKEKASLKSACALDRHAITAWDRLEAKSKKLAEELKAPKLSKASLLYAVAHKAEGAELLYLLYKSTERLVVDRIKNYLQKHLAVAQEVTDQEVTEATKLHPGTAKFEKAKELFIAKRMDARPKKVEVGAPLATAVQPAPSQVSPRR